MHHFTLGFLYEQNLKHRNIWSRSNEGFDLARYKGTKLIFYQSPLFSYIVWWERDFGTIDPKHYRRLHPANALLEKNHFFMPSAQLRPAKRKTIFIAPPSTQTSGWSFMKEWCNIPLFRFGVTIFNLNTPFLHKDYVTPAVKALTRPSSKGGNLWEGASNESILPQDDHTASSGNDAFYNWMWDDGRDNKIGTKKKEKYNPISSNGNFSATYASTDSIYHTRTPYWLLFFGAGQGYLNWDQYDIYIWWYCDDNQVTDPSLLRPGTNEAPNYQKKFWMKLGASADGGMPLLAIQRIAQNGPFCQNPSDFYGEKLFNLFLKYKSYWTWGGIHPTPAENLDPCTVDPNTDPPVPRLRRAVSPFTAQDTALHPWDLDRQGLITKQKLKELFGFPPSELAGIPKTLPQSSSESEEEGPLRSVRRKRSRGEGIWQENDSDQSDKEAADQISLLTKRLKRERNFRIQLRDRLRHFLKQ